MKESTLDVKKKTIVALEIAHLSLGNFRNLDDSLQTPWDAMEHINIE